MKSTKNKTFRIQQRNQHLKNILEESYYIELGTVLPQVMEKIMLGEVVKLEDIYHTGLLTEGVGRITDDSLKEVKYQFTVLNSLRNKSASNKIFLTCGLLHYHLNDDTEYYAPIVLIPVEIDFNDETIVKSSKPIINNILINEIQAHLAVDISYDATFKYLYDIDNYCIELAKKTECTCSVGNYLTVLSVEYTENVLSFEDFSTERSIYEIEPKVILQDYFEKVKSVVPTNIYQKRALLKINNGESFVVDGKVSTGKTQTILNAIANAVQKNKKVLYVSQDTNSIKSLETELRKHQLANYTYNLCRNYQILYDESNVIPNIREEKIGIETITPICYYEDALYASVHGCNYSKIVTRLALIKNQMPEIQKIPIEVSLENHEIQEVYQNLKDIENILDEIEPLDINVWSGLEQYYNKSHASEIISSTKKYASLLKQFNKDMNIFTKKYGINLPTNFINAQKLLTYISTFEKLMPPAVWTKKYDPAKINELLETISNFQMENNKLSEVYDEYLNPGYVKNNIKSLLESICYNHLTIENEYEINNILRDYDVIKSTLTNIAKEQKINTKELYKLAEIINNNDFDHGFFKYLENIVNLINTIDVKSEWVDFYLRNTAHINDHYQRVIEVINRYVNTKEQLQKYLIKGNSLTYNQIKELSNNKDFIKLIVQMFNKKQLKQNRLTTEECCKMVIDLIELGDKLLDEVKNTNVFDKDNFDSFIIKYKTWIDFVLSLDKKTTKIFTSHLSKHRHSIVDKTEFLNVYNEFSRSTNALEDLYISLSRYGIEFEKELITEKNIESTKWIEYLNGLLKTIETLKKLYKKTNITFDDLIKIINTDNEYANLSQLLNENQHQMKTYLGTTYQGLETNCALISVLEKHYGYFIKSLTNKDHIYALFENNLMRPLVEENSQLLRLADNLKNEHNMFSRYFVGGQSSILECSLQDSVKKIHRYEERTKEIKLIFQIFEYVKYFDRLGLKHIGEGILESKYSKGISEIYIYSTYSDYQLELINKNPILSDAPNILLWLENYNYFERNYCISSLKNLERNKMEIDKRILNKVKKIPFNYYNKIINELINYKNVFLIDLNMFNSDIDYSQFDLVLVDDVHLSTSFKYNSIMDCNQVVLFGDSSQTINNSNSMFSIIPKRKVLHLPMGYMKDNPQYGNVLKGKNEYILDFKKTVSTIQFDDLNSLVKQIVVNFYKDTTKKINILLRSTNYKVIIIKCLIKHLKEYFSDDDIFDLLEHNINLILVPRENTRVCDEAYFLFDDFSEMDVELFKSCITNYSTAKLNTYVYGTHDNLLEVEDIPKYMNELLKYNTKNERVMSELVQIIYNELHERGIKVEQGHGCLDLIVKGKVTRGKVVTQNVGIIIEGLDTKISYSKLNDYQYYYNEYTNNGWKIFILFVDDIINNLQVRLDQISKYLSKDDEHITHQLKIDEFLG